MRGADAAARRGSAMDQVSQGLALEQRQSIMVRSRTGKACRRHSRGERQNSIAPRPRPGSTQGESRRWRVVARAAPRMAAAYPRQAHPRARPQPMPLDRFVRVGRAGRQIPALTAEQGRERELVEADQRVSGAARAEDESAHEAPAPSFAVSRAAIWPRASTTALNVSRVEAWRAL